MKTTTLVLSVSIVTLTVLAGGPAGAQQTTGTPGSPSATTTIDGKYIPNPPAPFAGKANLGRGGFQTRLAADRRAAQGRAQRAV